MTISDWGFVLSNIVDDGLNPFARQEAIEGWDQDILRRAHVLVVGAGAIGNEVLKNLALLGVGNIYIVDRDVIEVSNLSRSLLFTPQDNGRPKAEVAAIRTQQMCLEPSAHVKYWHGDIVHQLGLGVFRRMDLVLGALDNIEARIALCKGCWAFDKPWIDGSIAGYMGNVSIYAPPTSACYLCTLSSADHANRQQSYSCDNRKRRLLTEKKIPSIQTISAIVAATQVQEGLKALSGTQSRELEIMSYDAYSGKCAKSFLVPDDAHELHSAKIEQLKLLQHCSHSSSVIELANALAVHIDPERSSLQLEEPFVTHAVCRKCNHSIPVDRPLFTIYADEYATCSACHASNSEDALTGSELTVALENITSIPLSRQSSWARYTLQELGIPALAVIQVDDGAGQSMSIELTADEHSLFRDAAVN